MRAPRSSRGAPAAAPCALPAPAVNRSSMRVSGGDPLDNVRLRDFLDRLRRNTREFDAEGRVLRLKRFISANCRPQVIDAVLDALRANTRVEVLYIQNFEQGFGDDQLRGLLEVLKLGRIWAVNVGENFKTSLPTWREFAAGLKETDVQYMYASEHHFLRTDLKIRMRDAIRVNRNARKHRHDPEVVRCVGNMWFNPRVQDVKGAHRSANPKPRRPAARQVASQPLRSSSTRPVVVSRGGKRRIVLTERASAIGPVYFRSAICKRSAASGAGATASRRGERLGRKASRRKGAA